MNLALALLFVFLSLHFFPQPFFDRSLLFLLTSQFLFHFFTLAQFQIFQTLLFLLKLSLTIFDLFQLFFLLLDFSGMANKFILFSLNFLLFFLFFLFFLSFASLTSNNSFKLKRGSYITIYFYSNLFWLFSPSILNTLEYFLDLLDLMHHLFHFPDLFLLLLFFDFL